MVNRKEVLNLHVVLSYFDWGTIISQTRILNLLISNVVYLYM